MTDDKDNEDVGEILDEFQDALYEPVKWSWSLFLADQASNLAEIVEHVGEMFHITSRRLRTHHAYVEGRRLMFDDTMREIERLPEV